MTTLAENKIVRLPDYEGVAPDMSAFFGPNDVEPGKITIRKGMMATRDDGPGEVIMVYARPDDGSFDLSGLLVLLKEGEEFIMSKGTYPVREDLVIALMVDFPNDKMSLL